MAPPNRPRRPLTALPAGQMGHTLTARNRPARRPLGPPTRPGPRPPRWATSRPSGTAHGAARDPRDATGWAGGSGRDEPTSGAARRLEGLAGVQCRQSKASGGPPDRSGRPPVDAGGWADAAVDSTLDWPPGPPPPVRPRPLGPPPPRTGERPPAHPSGGAQRGSPTRRLRDPADGRRALRAASRHAAKWRRRRRRDPGSGPPALRRPKWCRRSWTQRPPDRAGALQVLRAVRRPAATWT